MNIRRYTDVDWEAVRVIYDLSKRDEMRGSVPAHAVLPLASDPNQLALFRQSTVIVAVESKDVLGFVGYEGSYISWLFVHPDHRRRGVGTTLVSAVLQHMPQPVTLNVGANNSAARALYKRLGFLVEREFLGQFNGYEVPVLTMRYERANSGK